MTSSTGVSGPRSFRALIEDFAAAEAYYVASMQFGRFLGTA